MTPPPQGRYRRLVKLREFTDRIKEMDDKALEEELARVIDARVYRPDSRSTALALYPSDEVDADDWLWLSCMAAARANRLER